MKFNTELLQKTLPEWRLYFLNYAVLKRLIQHILASERAEASGTPQELNWSSSDDEQIKRKSKHVLPGSVQRTEFWSRLEMELEKIYKFYTMKITWADEQLQYLETAIDQLEESCRKDTSKKNANSPKLLSSSSNTTSMLSEMENNNAPKSENEFSSTITDTNKPSIPSTISQLKSTLYTPDTIPTSSKSSTKIGRAHV